MIYKTFNQKQMENPNSGLFKKVRSQINDSIDHFIKNIHWTDDKIFCFYDECKEKLLELLEDELENKIDTLKEEYLEKLGQDMVLRDNEIEDYLTEMKEEYLKGNYDGDFDLITVVKDWIYITCIPKTSYTNDLSLRKEWDYYVTNWCEKHKDQIMEKFKDFQTIKK